MVTEITNGVKVSVETFYQAGYSNSLHREHMFAYRITIENKSTQSVKLISRHWFIYDAVHEYREVEGKGVVGEQPEILPGGMHQYVSGCNLKSPIGKMHGTYLMEGQSDSVLFEVRIPVFQLAADFILN